MIMIIIIIIKVMLVDLQIFCNGGSFSHSLPQACNLLLQLLMMIHSTILLMIRCKGQRTVCCLKLCFHAFCSAGAQRPTNRSVGVFAIRGEITLASCYLSDKCPGAPRLKSLPSPLSYYVKHTCVRKFSCCPMSMVKKCNE